MAKAAEYSNSLASALPGYVDGAGLQVDAGVYHDLRPVYSLLLGLLTEVDSTCLEAGSEGYVVALLVYAALQAAARQNVPGTQAAADALGTRFAEQRRNSKKGQQATPAS